MGGACMSIVLVHDFLIRSGGAERVLSVLAHMFPDAPIFTLLYDEKKMSGQFPRKRVHCSYLQKIPHMLRKNHKYLFPLMPGAIERFDLSKFDVVISSSSAYSHGIITPTKTVHVNYCHSPMRYAWDWYHQYVKEQQVNKLAQLAIRVLMKRIRLWDRIAADRADVYIANSLEVQKRIQKYYRRQARVIYPPVDIERFKISNSHEDFFLIVSNLTPYKRIDLAIQLFNKIKKRLVIVGDGSDRKRLESLAQPHIDFVGFKPDEVVGEYYRNCTALIFPGEEDFGIAPVEALACGKPVLAYGKGGLTESIIPGLNGEFFYEPTIDSMEDGLARLISNQRNYSARKIRQTAEKFSAERFIHEIKDLISSLKT